jgi:hypothetical protein
MMAISAARWPPNWALKNVGGKIAGFKFFNVWPGGKWPATVGTTGTQGVDFFFVYRVFGLR